MPFCVNCGSTYSVRYPCCSNCLTDPLIPEIRVESALTRWQVHPRQPTNRPRNFIVPTERTRFIHAILIAGSASILLGVFTFSIYLLLLFAAVAGMRWNEMRLRASGVEVSAGTMPDIDKLRRLAAYRVGVPVPPVFVERPRSSMPSPVGSGAMTTSCSTPA